jgi:hypothetical protein
MYHQVWEGSQTQRLLELRGNTINRQGWQLFPTGKTRSYANMQKILLSTKLSFSKRIGTSNYRDARFKFEFHRPTE